MKMMIANLINGNLTDAKRMAESKNRAKIILFLVENYGWSLDKARCAAIYLKTGDGFQAYCDAV
jgi:hypothetical protein